MRSPLRRGHSVSQSETEDRRFVAIVSESFVRHFFPNDNPIGRHFKIGFHDR